jgi:hypothetical protein
MENTRITRSYLEALSFSDLLKLADLYGIDVPENLNRGFLIGDILDVTDEMGKTQGTSEMVIADNITPVSGGKLPEMYNTTQIEVILRNPVWAFVFWNISENTMYTLRHSGIISLRLRVCSFIEQKNENPDDSFEIQIASTDKDQYVLLPVGKRYIAVELIAVTRSGVQKLANSRIVAIPCGSPLLTKVQPGLISDISPVMELSGVKCLLKAQYINHRQSFS